MRRKRCVKCFALRQTLLMVKGELCQLRSELRLVYAANKLLEQQCKTLRETKEVLQETVKQIRTNRMRQTDPKYN